MGLKHFVAQASRRLFAPRDHGKRHRRDAGATSRTRIKGAGLLQEWSSTNYDSQITNHFSIALAPRQGCLDPAQAIIHVRKLMLEMIEPVENLLIVI